ncbi:hypothetical protein JCM3774_003685 [Rhodotorula dairenensis]
MKIAFDPKLTKDWLVRALDPISDAEPALLADFILALLANDVASREELRASCNDQLVDFLEHNTAHFVDALMQYLEAPHDTSIPLLYGNGGQEQPVSLQTGSQDTSPRDRKRPRTPPQSYPPGVPYKQPRITPNPFLYPPAMGQSAMPGFNGRPMSHVAMPIRGYCPRGATCPFQHDVVLPPGLPTPASMAAAAGMPARPAQRRQQPTDRGAPPARGRPSRGETRCIRVEHIPPHCASEAAVRQFFNPFGTIARVSADKNACTAIVAFSNPAEAERALASPQPIFGNRFVRTYRTQEDPSLFASVMTDASTEDAKMDGGEPAKVDRAESLSSTTGPTTAAPSGAQSQPNIPAASAAKARAADRAQQLEANSARQKEVLAQLDGADKDQKRTLLKEMRSLTEVAERLLREAKEAAAAPPAGPEDARARLERLRREASALGLAGGSDGYSASPSSSKPFYRGEPRPKRFKLDFRSRRILAGPVTDDTAAELQRHLEQYGTVRSLGAKEDASKYSFEFDTREAAEHALAAGAPSLQGTQVQLRWDSDAVDGDAAAA